MVVLTNYFSNRRYLEGCSDHDEKVDLISILYERVFKLIIQFFTEEGDIGLLSDN
jgi:hypothetical protein